MLAQNALLNSIHFDNKYLVLLQDKMNKPTNSVLVLALRYVQSRYERES